MDGPRAWWLAVVDKATRRAVVILVHGEGAARLRAELARREPGVCAAVRPYGGGRP